MLYSALMEDNVWSVHIEIQTKLCPFKMLPKLAKVPILGCVFEYRRGADFPSMSIGTGKIRYFQTEKVRL
jgi:hypothetical protein